MQFHWELHNMVVQHCDCDNPPRTNNNRPRGSVCVLCMVWPAAPTTYKNMIVWKPGPFAALHRLTSLSNLVQMFL